MTSIDFYNLCTFLSTEMMTPLMVYPTLALYCLFSSKVPGRYSKNLNEKG